MRPLDRLPSIKLKLGVIIVVAVAGATIAVAIGVRAGLGWIISFGLSVALGLAAVQVLARGMTSPLREMVAATHAMARGDYSRRVTASSHDEVGELAKAFNRMAGELAEVDRMRRDLVANVSHELRTPIAALQALLDNALDGVAPIDPTSVETMSRQVQRLARLVDQLLDLSKLESGVIPLEVRDFPVRDVLAQSVKEAQLHAVAAEDRAIEIELRVEPEDLSVRGDPERIHQVVSNLVENAVRHSPEGATVSVRAFEEGGEVFIQVDDQGPGISAGERDKVFERFYRSDASRSSGSGGSGLGLAIARWVVDLHGGRISIGANEPNGCRVSVALPEARS